MEDKTKKLILYHGSKSEINGNIKPSSRKNCDFGRGFYLGTDILQAKTLICEKENPTLYKIELDLNGLKILNIEDYHDWISVIAYNRKISNHFKGEKAKEKEKYSKFLDGYDLVIGDIADDRMFLSFEMYSIGLMLEDTLTDCLKTIKLGKQYVCKTQKACDNLKILRKIKLKPKEFKKLISKKEKNLKISTIVIEKIRANAPNISKEKNNLNTNSNDNNLNSNNKKNSQKKKKKKKGFGR